MEETGIPTELYFTKIPIIIICILGIIGHILSAIVLVQKEMRSSFNYLLLGLTFSDILILIQSFVRTLADFRLINLWGGPQIQNIFLFFLDWMCTSGTKYFTVAISIERFIAICHPIRAKLLFAKGREMRPTLGVYVFTLILSIFSYIYVNYIDAISFQIYAAIVLHFLPLFLVVILNILVYFGLRDFQKKRTVLTKKETREVSITYTLLIIVLVFGFCYSFEFVRRIILYFKSDFYSFTLTTLADTFYVLNSAVNFIIYCLLGTKFRAVLVKLMRRCINVLTHGSADDNTTSTGLTSHKSEDSH